MDVELRKYELKDGPNTVALFPAMKSSTYGLGFLLPLPISDYNNIIIVKEYRNRISEILESLKELSREEKSVMTIIPFLEKSHYSINTNGFHGEEATGTMVLDLENNPPEKIWREIFTNKKKQREKIKQLENDGYKRKRIENREDLDTYYQYYKKNMNFIHATPLEFKHFDLILKNYDKSEVNAWLLTDGENVAGGLISFYYDPLKTVDVKYLSLNRCLPKTYTPTFSLYWNAILQAQEVGAKTVCFGSTYPDPESGQYKIKERMGCEYEGKISYYVPRNFVVWKAFKLFKKLNGTLGRDYQTVFGQESSGKDSSKNVVQ